MFHFFTIHSAAGTRIDDESDNLMTWQQVETTLANMAAESVTLADGEPAWKVGDDSNGYQFLRTVGYEA